MSRKPTPPGEKSASPTGKGPERRRSAAKPVEAVGQTLERALDPLASAIKRAALRRADRQSRAFDEPAAETAPASPAKGALPVSPLAVPFPRIPPIDGVELATGRAGFYKHDREDLLVMRFAEGTSVAGVFTRHGVGSAPVDWCRRALAQSQGEDARALVVNAGCANAFTGKPGADAARRVASAVAKRFDCRQRDVMIASTGVIGVLLDDAKITQRLPEVETALAADGWAGAARAIMTTDTFPKGAAAVVQGDGGPIHISGIAKGSGMIAPDMATMLVYIFTDAKISAANLQKMIWRNVDDTFNSITVDSDTSTSDTLLIAATGKSDAAEVKGPVAKAFEAALRGVMMNLAHQVVRDGEGATKFVEVQVTGAATDADAHKAALAIANSPLVKTAIAGQDPNWGRIVAAIGKSGAEADRDRLTIKFGDILVAEKGWRNPDYKEEDGAAYMLNPELLIHVDMGLGKASRSVWTCDLTNRYIEINADYRS